MPAARFLTIELTAEGFFLFRYAEDGAYAGDTLHRSVDEAHHDAELAEGAGYQVRDRLRFLLHGKDQLPRREQAGRDGS